MSILTGPEIRRRVAAGDIEIDPFVDAHVNPASVDLTLGINVREFEDWEPHDVKQQEQIWSTRFINDEGILLFPGRLYLMHTREIIYTKKFVPILDGKSSIARLGVMVHLTAGFGDTGFRGQYTLEVVSFRLVRLYAGMRICQMRFHEVVGDVQEYAGNYVGETAIGPVESQAHKQFEKSDPEKKFDA